MRTYATIDAFGLNTAREALESRLQDLYAEDLPPWDEDFEVDALFDSAEFPANLCGCPASYIDGSEDEELPSLFPWLENCPF